jgi:hypothetical protein
MKDIRTTSHNVVGFIENAQGRKLVIGPKTTISEPFVCATTKAEARELVTTIRQMSVDLPE